MDMGSQEPQTSTEVKKALSAIRYHVGETGFFSSVATIFATRVIEKPDMSLHMFAHAAVALLCTVMAGAAGAQVGRATGKIENLLGLEPEPTRNDQSLLVHKPESAATPD